MATKGIAAAGKERITREIEVHFAEAVEAHIAKGEPQEIAQASALAELGDAKTARRRFLKKHLTTLEEKHVLNWRNDGNSKRQLLLNLFLGGLLIAEPVISFKTTFLYVYMVIVSLGFIVFPIFIFWLLRQPSIKSKLSLLVFITLIQGVFCTFGIATLAFSEPSYRIIFGGVLLCLIGLDLGRFKTWRKIRKYEKPAIGN